MRNLLLTTARVMLLGVSVVLGMATIVDLKGTRADDESCGGGPTGCGCITSSQLCCRDASGNYCFGHT